MSKKIILSGMRPTGKLHIGHMSVLENWVRLQDEYQCYFMAADWHALTTSYDATADIRDNIYEMMIDFMAAGLDPERSVLFVQSQVKAHAELHLLFSMMTPLSWLERCPTYKDQMVQLKEQGKDINTYGFLGYPLLQAADILIYGASAVPVGEDQLPHLEMTREVARRFNHLYESKVFPEPKALLSEQTALLPGIDGRKMSKSYGNEIAISATPEEIWEKVRMMVTDPQRIRKNDPGHPEVCVVYKYQQIYNREESDGIADVCRKGEMGCFDCKKRLAAVLDGFLAPVRERRARLAGHPETVRDVLEDGRIRAMTKAEETMEQVREAMQI